MFPSISLHFSLKKAFLSLPGCCAYFSPLAIPSGMQSSVQAQTLYLLLRKVRTVPGLQALSSGRFFFFFVSGLPRLFSGKQSNAADTEDVGLIPGSGRSSGEGNGNMFQYSSLENTKDRETWRATVHGAARSWP